MNTTIIIAALALIACIVLSTKCKLPLGILAMIAAFLVGYLCLNIAPNKVVAQWPSASIFNMIMATTFFGFLSSNGTMLIIGKRMVSLIKGNMKLFPLIATVLFAVVSFGAGAGATWSLGPVLYVMGIEGGIAPAMVCLILGFAGMMGSVNPWTGHGGIIVSGHIAANGYTNNVNIMLVLYITFIVVFLIVLALFYFVFKCYKAKTIAQIPAEELVMNEEQKKSYYVFIVALLLIIVPAVLTLIFPKSALIKTLSNVFSTNIIFTVGIIVCIILKLGTFRDALNKIPMPVVLLTAGMTMLIYVVKEADVTTVIGNALNGSVPAFLIPAALALLSALMSFFSSSVSVVVPLFFPIAIQLAASTGANPVVYMACVFCGSMASACSPMSGSGIAQIAVAPSEEQDKLSKQMLVCAVIIPIIVAVMATVGIVGIIPAIFGTGILF